MASLALTRIASVVARVKSWAEGAWRGPLLGQDPYSWRMYELGDIDDGFQRNLHVSTAEARYVPMVYACVMANARAAATCWPTHRRESTPDSGRFDRVTTSPAARIFRDANPYESWAVFLLNMVATMGFDGQAFALVVRDSRNAITALHRMPRMSCSPMVSPEDGSVYYRVGGNPFLPDLDTVDYIVPARDVWHLRQHCPRHPLLGESPTNAAALALGVNVALSRSQAVFFARMSRPSGVLVSDQQLNKEQITRLRENWNAQSALLAQGGVPILGNGVKWQAMSLNSEDAEVIAAARYSGEDIARVHGIPLPVVGELTHSTLTNVEQLVSLWLSTGLTSLLELLERDLNRLFGFDGIAEYADLDTRALLRTDFAGRVAALVKGIQGALYTPNEARAFENLPPVDEGDEVYAQAQMQPLGTPLASAAPAAGDGDGADTTADDGDGTDAEDAADTSADTTANDDAAKAVAQFVIERAMRRQRKEVQP